MCISYHGRDVWCIEQVSPDEILGKSFIVSLGQRDVVYLAQAVQTR